MMVKKKVLIIEHESRLSEGFSEKLRLGNCDICTAHSSQAAILSMRMTLPHLILLDALAPEMIGYDIGKWLRLNAATHVPVVTFVGDVAPLHVADAE